MYGFIILTLLMLFQPATVGALNPSLELGIGYDDNVAQTTTEIGSSFGFGSIHLEQILEKESFAGNLMFQGRYCDYFRLDDNYELAAQAKLNWSLLEGRLLPGISADGLIYQDNYLVDDSHDEAGIGFFAEWIAASRLTLAINQAWRWADYPDYYLTSRASNAYGNSLLLRSGPHGPMDSVVKNEHRHDYTMLSNLVATVFPAPEWQADLSLKFAQRNSSAQLEAYSEKGLGLSWLWSPIQFLAINLTGAFSRLDYEHSPEAIERRDDICSVGVEISRRFGAFELRAQFDWEYDNSSIESQEYRQRIIQCGAVWSF